MCDFAEGGDAALFSPLFSKVVMLLLFPGAGAEKEAKLLFAQGKRMGRREVKGLPREDVPQGGESCLGKKQEREGIFPMPSLPRPHWHHVQPSCQVWRCWPGLGFLVPGRGMPFPGRGPGVNHVALFTLDTLYTAVQSAGEVKASEMVHDATW